MDECIIKKYIKLENTWEKTVKENNDTKQVNDKITSIVDRELVCR